MSIAFKYCGAKPSKDNYYLVYMLGGTTFTKY